MELENAAQRERVLLFNKNTAAEEIVPFIVKFFDFGFQTNKNNINALILFP